jgi:hypothetical protein
VTLVQDTGVDREAILRHLNLDPRNVNTQALLLICDKYGLDPLLKHVVLIQGRPYITRDGYLHIAHHSQQLDGIEILDEGESDTHWWAKAAVYRKDMARPFSYRGRYPKGGGNKDYGPEMAIKTAEVMALRRAFNVTGAGAADERWDEPGNVVQPEPPADHETHEAIRRVIHDLPDQADAIKSWWTEQGLPPISKADRLTEAQADTVLSYLGDFDLPDDGRPFEEADHG